MAFKARNTAIGHLATARTTLSVAYKMLRELAGVLQRPC